MREASCLPILVLLVLAQLVPSSSQPLDGATLIDPDQARCAWADVAWDQCCRTASASCRMFVLCSWHQQCPGSLLAAVPPNLLMVVAIGIGGLLCFARLASVRTMSLPQFMSTISRPFAPYTAVATGLTQPPNNSSTDSTLDKGAHAVPSSMSDLLAQHATSGYACIHAQPWDLCLPDLALCLFFWCCYTLCVVQWTFEGAAYPSWAVAAAVVGIVVSYCLVRPVWAACCCCPCVADDDCRPGTSPVRTARTPGARMGAALGKSRLVTPDQAVRLIEGWKQAPVKLVQDPGSPTAGPIPLIEHCCDRTDDVGDVLRAVTAPTRVMVVPDVELQGALLGQGWMDPGWVPKVGGSSEHCLLVAPPSHWLHRYHLGASLHQHLYGLFALFQSQWVVCQWLQFVTPQLVVSLRKRVALAPGAHAVMARMRGLDEVQLSAC